LKVYAMSRGAGKATKLIKECVENGGYIVCHGKSGATRIFNEAKAMGLEIGFPLTYDEFLGDEVYGRDTHLYIDNADMLLQYISRLPIKQ